MKNKCSKVIHITKDSLASAWIKSIGIDVKYCPKHSLEDQRDTFNHACTFLQCMIVQTRQVYAETDTYFTSI